jgi:hypothetical protein
VAELCEAEVHGEELVRRWVVGWKVCIGRLEAEVEWTRLDGEKWDGGRVKGLEADIRGLATQEPCIGRCCCCKAGQIMNT